MTAGALRVKQHRFEDVFAPRRPLVLLDSGEPTGNDETTTTDAPPQDRRDVMIRIAGRASIVIPATDLTAERATASDAGATLGSTIDVDTPPAFDFLYDPPLGEARYRVGYGGRGKGSSWQFARALLIHGRTRPLRILCAREYQNSIKDSVHKLLSDQIDALSLRTHYAVQASSITGKNGTEFIFKGLRKDIAQIKSIEGIDICWVEEAEAVSKTSWDTLGPTIRRNGSEIWVSFNPALPTDDTYVRFVEKPPSANGPIKAIIRKVTYRDNPYLTDVLRAEEQAMLLSDPEAHANVWGGEPWSRSDAQVLAGKWRVDDFEPTKTWQGPYYGADWGFAQDPTMLVRLWTSDNRLFVEYEAGGIALSFDATARSWETIPDAERYAIRADSSRPESINEMKLRKYRVEPAVKWHGSVEDGIAHLRNYTEIIIHPRCKRAIQEARLWRYKTDKRTQEILPDLVEGNDHVWDATRYALAPLIRRREPRGADRSRSRSIEVA